MNIDGKWKLKTKLLNERNSIAVQMTPDGFGACVELANSRSSSKQKCKLVPLNPVTYSLLQRSALELLNQVGSLFSEYVEVSSGNFKIFISTYKPGSLR